MRAAVFLDRDGTVIHDRGYLATTAGVELLPGVGDALGELCRDGLDLILATNQSGIGRGMFSREVVNAQHRRLHELLEPFGARLTAIEVCPHLPGDGCNCRKPRPGMLLRASERFGISLPLSYMIGDKRSDVLAGRAAGCRALLVGKRAVDTREFVDLAAAAAWILGRRRRARLAAAAERTGERSPA